MSTLKSCLEDLSNETFMDIFDYLYGEQVFISFFNLNSRFKSICISYPKYYIKNVFLSKKLLQEIRHSIPSKHISGLCISTEKHILRISTKYLTRLHSLKLSPVTNSIRIKQFLEKLPSLNQLYDLSMYFFCSAVDIQAILKIIGKFTNLNRLELGLNAQSIDFSIMNQTLLSLKYFSINGINLNDFPKIVPFIPNLNYLKLILFDEHEIDSTSIPSNSLSKLKILEMDNIHNFSEMNLILQLCPYITVLKVNCRPRSDPRSEMIDAENWEQVLSPMKFLRKIEIHVDRCDFINDIIFDQYETNFWLTRNLKAGIYEIYPTMAYGPLAFCVQ